MSTPAADTFGFQAEVKQLLHLMVHSLYSDREIFLRELISNASDANDKLRFAALASPELAEEPGDLYIDIEIDKEQRSITVTDNGIGMSRDEVIENLGTIAHSGTARLVEGMTGDQRRDSQLIGQFGVGFYSAFIVAEQVEVTTRRAGADSTEGVRWISDGQGEFSVERVAKPERGTTVRIRLKEDAGEFLDPLRVKSLIRKYSDHIAFPVRMRGDDEAGDFETVNRAKALWARPRKDIEDSEYIEFYRHIAHDFSDPLAWTHNQVEGKREYTSLLYVPGSAPFDLWNREAPRGVKLYVQRVFITDGATQFLPLYLRFIRGIVDASDLPLNVSREVLQQDPHVAAIKSALTKRVLDMLERMAKDEPAKYATFWREFGGVLKEGIVEDPANRDRIASLLRFSSTRTEDDVQSRSLEDYVNSASAEQDVIYYLLAENLSAARSSPHLEVFADRDVEVLLMTDRLDEWMMQSLEKFKEKGLKDVTRGAIDLQKLGGEAPVAGDFDKDEKSLLKRVKRVLREQVDEVRFSQRLKESAACLVIREEDLGFQMRDLLRAVGQEAPQTVPSLELNARHPLVRRLQTEEDDARFEQMAKLVFDQAVLAEGRQLDDPAAFVKRLNALLVELATPAGDGSAAPS